MTGWVQAGIAGPDTLSLRRAGALCSVAELVDASGPDRVAPPKGGSPGWHFQFDETFLHNMQRI